MQGFILVFISPSNYLGTFVENQVTLCAALFSDQFSLWSRTLFSSEVFSWGMAAMTRICLFWWPCAICWALPGKCNWCHLWLGAVHTPPQVPTLWGLACLSSLGHWHWDDTGGVGVQPGNYCQVRVKGKLLSAPSFLSLKGGSHWRGGLPAHSERQLQ